MADNKDGSKSQPAPTGNTGTRGCPKNTKKDSKKNTKKDSKKNTKKDK